MVHRDDRFGFIPWLATSCSSEKMYAGMLGLINRWHSPQATRKSVWPITRCARGYERPDRRHSWAQRCARPSDAGRTLGLARQSASQCAISSRRKDPVIAEGEVRRAEWNGAPDPEKLRTYIHKSKARARRAGSLVDGNSEEARERCPLIRRCQELIVKLAEDRFTLAVVGQFKRGKVR